MTITKAKQILAENGIYWNNYFDLCFIENTRKDNWVGCENIREAIKRIQQFILTGK